MQFDPPLTPGYFIRRYKRFMVDVRLDTGDIITAHCPNTGSMLGLLEEGRRVGLSKSTNAKRAYAYTLEMMEEDGHFVGVNTQNPNKLVHEGLLQGLFPMLQGYETLCREVKIDRGTRLDFALTYKNSPTCYLEVKNVHYKKGNTAYFPDSMTERGQKHLKTLMEIKATGARCVMLYIIQRSDISSFSTAGFIDSTYATLAQEALLKGVEMYAFAACPTFTHLTLGREVAYVT